MSERKSREWMPLLMRAAGSCGIIVPRGQSGIHQGWTLFARYGFAVLLAGVAVWLRLLMNVEYSTDALRMLSVIAVALAAWFGGFGPGICATLIGLAGSLAIITGVPAFSLGYNLRLILFGITGLIVSALTEALTRTTAAWRRAEEAQENRVLQERNRMAREIHDTLAQGLTGIIIHLEAADDILEDGTKRAEVRVHLSRAQELSRMSLSEARRSVKALRPLSLEGQSLPDALADRVAIMTGGTGVEAALTVEGTPYPLPADQEDNLLRIGLEALTNTLRHAQARKVQVTLRFDADHALLSVRDDGRGFLVDSPRTGGDYGLTGIRERAERIGGQLTLSSSPEQGTEIVIAVPRSPEVLGAGK